MSRKDYGVIAAIIRDQRCDGDKHLNKHLDFMVENLIMYFQEGNSKFDADRFRRATGVVVGTD